MTTIIGIDPGYSSGAVGVVGPDGYSVYDTPLVEKNGVNCRDLLDIIQRHNADHIFIERVGSMPRQGVSTTFKFGMGNGMVLAAVQIARVPYTLVTPPKWKQHHRLPKDKDAARARALQLFPSLSGDLARKKDADRAEALLIAAYGQSVIREAVA